jgi:voltage-gated potassium channel Kch
VKVPFVKEWGSWVVFSASCLVALITGLMTRPWEAGRAFVTPLVLTVIGMFMLINSKNPLASLVRTKGEKTEHMLWFVFFSTAGLLLLTPFLVSGMKHFFLFSLLGVSYAVFLKAGKEHHILAELNGFALLTLSAPILFFVITGRVSLRLYAAVLVFFGAGVFKVKVRLRKTVFSRAGMVLYCVLGVIAFSLLNVSALILLPLLENVISSFWMREEKLRTTGYIEMAKSMAFVMLMLLFWH